jgi:hypothetical protein
VDKIGGNFPQDKAWQKCHMKTLVSTNFATLLKVKRVKSNVTRNIFKQSLISIKEVHNLNKGNFL